MNRQQNRERGCSIQTRYPSGMSRRIFLSLGTGLVLAATSAALPSHAAEMDPARVPFAERSVTTASGTYKYLIYAPVSATKAKSRP
jgi:hypothetical protein